MGRRYAAGVAAENPEAYHSYLEGLRSFAGYQEPELDLRETAGVSSMSGVRGKYHRAYRQGHTVKIQQADGTTSVHYFKLEEGAVMLDPDVREHFSDSETVNAALRSLIALIPRKHDARAETTSRAAQPRR